MTFANCHHCHFSGFVTTSACPECGAPLKLRPGRQVANAARRHLHAHGTAGVDRLTRNRARDPHAR